MKVIYKDRTCPQCGFSKIIKDRISRYEQDVYCPRCGYTDQTRLLLDSGEMTKQSSYLESELPYENQSVDENIFSPGKHRKQINPILGTSPAVGYGILYVARQASYDVVGDLYTFSGPLTPDQINATIKGLTENRFIVSDQSCLATWDQDSRQAIVHFGTKTPEINGVVMDFDCADGLHLKKI